MDFDSEKTEVIEEESPRTRTESVSSSESEYSTCDFIDMKRPQDEEYKREWITDEELPFYLDLIDKYNQNVFKIMNKQEEAHKKRKCRIQEFINQGDVAFIKPKINKIDLPEINYVGPTSTEREDPSPHCNKSAHNEEKLDESSSTEEEKAVVTTFDPNAYPDPGAKFPECKKCDLIFRSVEEYKSHVESSHMNELPFRCEVCLKIFRTMTLLRQHKRIHGEKKFCCATCGDAFVFEITLIRHERVHTKVRPYVCTICSKAFTQPNHLKAHGNVHSRIKQWECFTCDKKYANKSSLIKHCINKKHVS